MKTKDWFPKIQAEKENEKMVFWLLRFADKNRNNNEMDLEKEQEGRIFLKMSGQKFSWI